MKNKTNTYLIFSVTVAVVAICAYAYASSFVSGLTDRTTSLRSDVQAQEIKLQSIQSLNRSAQNSSSEMKMISGLFVQPNKAVDFVTMMEHSAAALSLEYSTTQIDSQDTDLLSSQNKEILKMSMTLSGSWKNVLKFLEYVETLPYAVDIQKAELSSDSAGKSWKLGITFAVVKIKDNAR